MFNLKELDNDTAKELFMVLTYCDNEFINIIPNEILKGISDKAADSTKTYYIDINKPLLEQTISDKCLLALGNIYLTYNNL